VQGSDEGSEIRVYPVFLSSLNSCPCFVFQRCSTTLTSRHLATGFTKNQAY
jgi:hypothetical protein